MTQYHDSELDHKLRDLSVMYELMSSIGSSLDLQVELDHFLQKVLKRFGFSLGSLLLKSEEEGYFYVASSWGHLRSLITIGHKCQANMFGINKVVETRKPLLLNDLSGHDENLCIIPEVWKRTRSLVYLPITFEQDVIGILRLFSFSDKVISEKLVRMMTPLVARLGTVISHIMMLNRLRETEKKLRDEKDFNETALNSLTDLFVVIDPKTKKLIRWNRPLTEATGFTDEELAQGDFFSEGFNVFSGNPLDIVLSQPQDFYGPSESLLKTKSRMSIPIEISASRFIDENNERDYIIAVGRDIQERKNAEREKKELEEELQQKYKMEAVGLMAGGIAHNFNNSLAIVLGNLDMAQRKSDHPDKVKSYIGNAQTAVLRARDLVGQIMTYSRKEVHEKEPVRLAGVIDETLKLLHSTNPTTIKLTYEIKSDLESVSISADPSRIQEALLNLYTNAVHAMNEKGEISFTLETVLLDSGDIPFQYDCEPGNYVKLSVQDSGCGMSPETVSRIFDPFFTTKEQSLGTGMGLSTVQGIVNQHDGFIKVASVRNHGTVFFLYFPVSEQQVDSIQKGDDLPPRGTEHILCVDDEELIAELIYEMLSSLGYRVTTANNGYDALELLKADPGHYNLVISDQTMPGMTGKELAREITEIDGHLPVILCTGYSSKLSATDIGQHGISAICSKPLQLIELSKIVRRTIDNC